MKREESFSNPTCADQALMAELELSAFTSAVTELFGPEQARLAAEDWLDELESTDSPLRSTSRDWRAVTVAALAKMANRLTSPLHDRSAAVPSSYAKASPILCSKRFSSPVTVSSP
jgi:hypothetical protein